jgi:hypothetical protein
MPLCPQITNTPITVTQTADFTVSSVLPVVAATTTQVDAAQSDATEALAEATAAAATAAAAVTTANAAAATAGTAQSTANTALANAATAYTAAIGSLQPSASTIVNASNQMTAIASNGITVYSGASASSGARVVMNSLGLAGYDASNNATFSISASTGAAVFSGSVTGSTITGGTLNIAGNAIINSSGLLTATGATITGTINATSGYFGTSTNGFSISSTGLVGVGTGTIVGGIISGAQFINGGGTFSVSSAGVLIASSATITGTINATGGYIGSAANGWNFSSSGYLTNSGLSTILYPTTAPGGNANTYAFYSDRGVYGSSLYASSTSQGAITTLGGIQADGRLYTAAGNFVVNTSGNITTVGSIAATGAITTSSNISTSGSGTITSAGQMNANGELYASQAVTNSVTAATNCYITTGGLIRRTSNVSSIRFKENVTDISNVSELDPKKLLDLPVVAFSYKQGHIPDTDDRAGQMLPGFIAEDVDALYPIAADYEAGNVETWNSFYVVPAMLSLIQDLYKEVQTLKGE